jgi:TonB family protein
MFETALLSSPSIVRRGSLLPPLSISVHAAVVLVLVGASLWRDEPLSEIPVPVVFVPGPPAPPPRGSEDESVVREGAASTVPRTIPRDIPQIRPALAPAAPVDDSGAQDSGSGSALGVRDGAEDGTGSVPGATGTSDGGGEEDPIVVGGKVTAPVLVHRVEPEYPEPARKAGMEGVVILQAIISATGQVEELQVLRSPVALLGDAATRAVRQWRYLPSTLNGRAVRVFLTVSVTFRLR